MAAWYSSKIVGVEAGKKSPGTGEKVALNHADADGDGGSCGPEGALTCEEHPSMALEMFCSHHDEVLCSACVAHYHRNCTGLVAISEMKTASVKKKELKQSAKELTELRQKLVKIKQAKREELKMIECDTNQALKDIAEFRELINWVLDRMERKGKEYIEKRHKEFSKFVKEDLAKCDEMIETIDKRLKRVAKSEDADSTKAFVEMKKRKEMMRKAGRFAEVAKNNQTKPIVKFAIDPKVEQFARSLSWYGKDRTYLSFEPPLSFPHLYTVKSDTQFDIRVKGDRSVCAVIDACQLRNGTLLLTDASNRRLKQLDVLYQVVDHLDLPAEPTAVAAVNEERAVVTLAAGGDSLVQFVDVRSSLKLDDHSFSIPEKCTSLACCAESIYVASSGAINVFSLKGELLQKVYNGSGNIIHSLTLNHDMSKLHFMESSKGLVTIHTDGEELGLSRDESFSGKCGVAADGNGQIFTCGHDSHVITQFSHDHSNLGVILTNTDGVKFPLAVTFDRLHTRLVVTMKSKNVIKIFDLK